MRDFFDEIGTFKEELVEKISKCFSRWAGFVYRHPYWVIAGSSLVCLCCGIGLIPPIPEWVDGAENLYSLPDSLARDHGAIHRSLFNEVYKRSNIVVIAPGRDDPDENIFTWEQLELVQQIDRLIRGQTVDPLEGRRIAIQKPSSFEGENEDTALSNEKDEADSSFNPIDDRGDASDSVLTFQDLCSQEPNGRCSVQSVLEMGVFSIKDAWGIGEPGDPPELYMFDGMVISPDVRGFIPDYLLGNLISEPCMRDLPRKLAINFVPEEQLLPSEKGDLYAYTPTNCITGASAFLMVYDLKDHPSREELNLAWEMALIQVLTDNDPYGGLRVSLNAFRSRDDELRSSTSGSSDILFVILTFVILISYAAALNFSCDLYRSKSFPALAGAGAALMGLVSGLGFVCLLGVAFVPTALICPFLVMGIGVDDMFVIVNAYALAYTVDHAQDRVSVALGDAGLSITITTLTNLIAFAVGAFSPYLSIRNFCIFSAASLFMGYFFVLTFFLAFLCLDAKREEAARVCLFCLPEVTEKEMRRQEAASREAWKADASDPGVPANGGTDPAGGGAGPGQAVGMGADISTFSLVSFKARATACRLDNKAAAARRLQQEGVSTTSKSGRAKSRIRAASQRLAVRKSTGAKSEADAGSRPTSQDLGPAAQTASGRVGSSLYLVTDRELSGAVDPRCVSSAGEHGAPPPSAATSVRGSRGYGGGRSMSSSRQYREEDTRGVWVDDNYGVGGMPHSRRGYRTADNGGGERWTESDAREWQNQNLSHRDGTPIDDEYGNGGDVFDASGMPASSFGGVGHRSQMSWRGGTSWVEGRGGDKTSFENNPDKRYIDGRRLEEGLRRRRQHEDRQIRAAHELFLEEPKGNVGRKWRKFFLTKYGPTLTRPYVKLAVLICFAIFLGVSTYGLTNLEQGLELKELSPDNSYLQSFDQDLETYFTKYDVPVEIFFTDADTEWWRLDVQESLFELQRRLLSRESTKFVSNSLLRMVEDPELSGRLTSGRKETFEATLFDALSSSSSRFHQFEGDFVWQGQALIAWKFSLLPAQMTRSEERAAWMRDIRDICSSMKSVDPPLNVLAYNYMMIFYESDLGILKSVVINMLVAAVAMLLVAFILIPQIIAGLLVILTMTLIDIGLFGFMYFWDVKLNMVSMINLVISIGFAVDYSAHMCHTFTHCQGETKNLRTIETLVLMGNPVFQGAISTLLGIVMLGFSTSYIFRVFFKMFLMVIAFGLLHGIVLLPVLLSLIGSMSGHHSDPLEAQLEAKVRGNTQADDPDMVASRAPSKYLDRSIPREATTTDCSAGGSRSFRGSSSGVGRRATSAYSQRTDMGVGRRQREEYGEAPTSAVSRGSEMDDQDDMARGEDRADSRVNWEEGGPAEFEHYVERGMGPARHGESEFFSQLEDEDRSQMNVAAGDGGRGEYSWRGDGERRGADASDESFAVLPAYGEMPAGRRMSLRRDHDNDNEEDEESSYWKNSPSSTRLGGPREEHIQVRCDAYAEDLLSADEEFGGARRGVAVAARGAGGRMQSEQGDWSRQGTRQWSESSRRHSTARMAQGGRNLTAASRGSSGWSARIAMDGETAWTGARRQHRTESMQSAHRPPGPGGWKHGVLQDDEAMM